MNHIAIMKKSWGLTNKIINGEKKIESRWHNSKYPPWNRIKNNEIVCFKNSGEPVTIKAEVLDVLQFSNLNQKKVKELLFRYGKDDGLETKEIPHFYSLFKDKKYCILIFLKNPKKIEPFEINKRGFGSMSAWLCVNNINKIKK